MEFSRQGQGGGGGQARYYIYVSMCNEQECNMNACRQACVSPLKMGPWTWWRFRAPAAAASVLYVSRSLWNKFRNDDSVVCVRRRTAA